jgi:uroporphyrinogen III methyltransferase/synthase
LANGIVYLVGAGPGDPGLLTRRGAEVLGRADVVAYDRLVHPDLLKLAMNAELVDVGKQPGQSASGQARINEVLIESARAGKTVVRLKGGDPFVFGRGGEEAELLAAAGVAFEIVPGVTSAIAGPASAGIPLTHRDHASWAAIATGHEDPAKDASGIDWVALAHAPTAVFLMGMERLGEISASLIAAGQAADRPAAVIERATWPQQRVVRSTLEKIASAVSEAGVTSPAVLVVGDVVSLSEKLQRTKPLAGKRVFVTRTRTQAGRLSSLLREAGADALEFPAIKIVPPESYAELDRAVAEFHRFGWIAFTSTNAVDAVWARVLAAGRDARAFADVRVASVGSATSDALRACGIVADLVPPTFTSEALAEAFGSPRAHRSGRSTSVLVPRAADAPADFVRTLRGRGWYCREVVAYRTETDADSVEAGRAAIDAGIDAVTFTSGSTVRSFVKLWGKPPGVVVAMGPRTAAVAEELGIHVDAVAATQTLDGLVAALVAAV